VAYGIRRPAIRSPAVRRTSRAASATALLSRAMARSPRGRYGGTGTLPAVMPQQPRSWDWLRL
jgi:hypothetical protein